MGSTRDIKMGSSSLLLLAAALALASAAPRTFTKDEIEIRDCGSKVEFKSITMDGCTGFPCVVHHGEHATGKLTAVAKASTSSLTCKISGIIPPGIELPFNGCPVNACENLSNGDCPVEEGEEFVYDMDPSKTSTQPLRSPASGGSLMTPAKTSSALKFPSKSKPNLVEAKYI